MSNYTGTDIYCDLIIPGRIERKVVFETDKIIAFNHTKPFWPVHIVVTPKQHVASLLELEELLASELLVTIKKLAKQVSDQHGACRVLTNLGEYQDSKHLHFHISSGEPLNQ